MFCRNMQLLFSRTADLNYFHMLISGRGIACSELAVVTNVTSDTRPALPDIMITETVVLFTVQHLQKRRKSISLIVVVLIEAAQ